MQFRENAEVFTIDGHKVGNIDRVVIDPRTNTVSHLVVHKGFLFGEDKVVPTELVANTTEDRVMLRQNADDLDLPLFEEVHYVAIDDIDAENMYPTQFSRPLYAYGPLSVPMPGGAVYVDAGHDIPAKTVTHRNIPEDAIALKEGATVISEDGKTVGNIEEIITAPDGHITHFVVEQGLIFTTEKRIPVFWIQNVYEDTVYLAVQSETLRSLPEYKENTL
jgi:uncharacterized protein YrrD